MASTFKTFLSDDITTTRTLLHEAIPITGSIVNGNTYNEVTEGANDTESGSEASTNIKTYGHGMFQSVYDYPYQSSSANHIFDITHGVSVDADTYDATDTFAAKRKNIYNQMAQVLVGHKLDGEIRRFDADGNLDDGLVYNSLVFFNFARLLGKDEIKKGTFELELGVTVAHDTGSAGAGYEDMHAATIKIKDSATTYKVNSPAGEYGILSVSNGQGSPLGAVTETKCGLIYYQAGIVAITTELFLSGTTPIANGTGGYLTTAVEMNNSADTIATILDAASSTMDEVSTAIRRRISNISFSNTTELNSTIYFCRVGHNDFNYSSNPTYLENSRIRVKDASKDAPVSYITTVGLYSSDNEMLAVAKLSEPLRKDPTNDMTLRVRLDY